MAYTILNGNNIQVLKTFPDNHFDSIVTDPPYGIDFLGKDWDVNTGALETYQECLRVLKPGGHILAFSAARTYHHLAITLEQAGFEIRDQIMWIYSSGFPKSQDVGKSIQRSEKKTKGRLGPLYTPAQGNPKITACEVCGAGNGVLKASKCLQDPCPFKEIALPADNAWAGWGTQLKPAHEPIAVARKPLDTGLSIARNCEQWGVGALNIDATRVPYKDPAEAAAYMEWMRKYPGSTGSKATFNNILSEAQGKERLNKGQAEVLEDREALIQSRANGRFPSNVIGEIAEPYQKYFYCPKVGRRERHVGFDTANIPQIGSTHPDDVKKHPLWDPSIGGNPARLKQKIIDSGTFKGNNHPTVKPIELMKYLVRLVTPAGGHVLDPFNGSGSTGCAAVELDYDYTGIELDPAYVEIAERRIAAWYATTHPLEATGLFE